MMYLYDLSKRGDSVASTIYIELKLCMSQITEKQFYSIFYHFILNQTLKETGEILDREASTIFANAQGGVKKISKILNSDRHITCREKEYVTNLWKEFIIDD